MTRRPLVALLPLAALVAGGCATARHYEGPARPLAELAMLEGAPRVNAGLPLAAVIRKVDARSVGVGYSRVVVEPGRHVLLVDCVMAATHSTTRHELVVDVDAGFRYRLVADSEPGNRSCGSVRLEER